jgi:hypothetical protein
VRTGLQSQPGPLNGDGHPQRVVAAADCTRRIIVSCSCLKMIQFCRISFDSLCGLNRYAGLEDFELVFPSDYTRSIFHEYVMQLKTRVAFAADEGVIELKPVRYEFEVDERDERIILGRGSFGCVLSALDLDTKKRVCLMASKAISCIIVFIRLR